MVGVSVTIVDTPGLTIMDPNYEMYFTDATNGDIYLQLPPINNVDGLQYRIKRIDFTNVDTNGGDLGVTFPYDMPLELVNNFFGFPEIPRHGEEPDIPPGLTFEWYGVPPWMNFGRPPNYNKVIVIANDPIVSINGAFNFCTINIFNEVTTFVSHNNVWYQDVTSIYGSVRNGILITPMYILASNLQGGIVGTEFTVSALQEAFDLIPQIDNKVNISYGYANNLTVDQLSVNVINPNGYLQINAFETLGKITPLISGAYDLGEEFKLWNNIYVNTLYSTTINTSNISSFTVDGDILISTTANLGTSSGRFNYLYANNVDATNITGGYTPTDSIIPSVNDSFTLGNPSNIWAHVFTNAINSGTILPNADATYNLGSSSLKWDTVYAAVGTIDTSDAKEKENITDSDLGLDFISELQPKSYKFKKGTSGRTHYGLVSQDVENTLVKFNKSGHDFAGFCKDTTDTGEEIYGLRYNEFIAPMIKAIQELKTIINQQNDKITNLETEIANLKSSK